MRRGRLCGMIKRREYDSGKPSRRPWSIGLVSIPAGLHAERFQLPLNRAILSYVRLENKMPSIEDRSQTQRITILANHSLKS